MNDIQGSTDAPSETLHLRLVRNVSAGAGAIAHVLSSRLTGRVKAELALDPLNAVSRVDILDQGKLPAGSTALAGGDGGGCQEVFPDLYSVD